MRTVDTEFTIAEHGFELVVPEGADLDRFRQALDDDPAVQQALAARDADRHAAC